ncbi:monomeric sarcosine oxidase [Pseudomonas sp. GV071]|nr:monomeric sarcosine oxidase [Pseudomonas sp. GV071]
MNVDVAVVGLGAMGAATLYQLAKRGVKVVGIDRFSPPHDQGSSHGDTRITRQAVGEGDAYAPLVRRAQQIWRELEGETGVPLFEQCGVLVMTSSATATSHHGTADFTERTLEQARRYGIDHEALDAAGIRARFPQFAPVLDSATGYYEPGGGYVRPEQCIATQLQLARQHGAQLLTGVTVTALEDDQGQTRVVSDGPTVYAKRVIVCAGMWNAGLLGAPFDQLLRVCRQTLYWFELEQPSIFPSPSPTFILAHGPTDEDLCYGFPPLPGENSMKIATEQYGLSTAPDALNRQVTEEECAEMFAGQLVGKIAGVKPKAVKTAVCTYTVTPDFHFIIDQHPTRPAITVVSACSGHGFKHSAAIGEALAQQVVDGHSELDLSAFSLARFAPREATV